MRRSPVPVVSKSDRKVLESWVRSTSVPAGLARRARIVLLATDGVGTNEVADRTGTTRPTVIGWRNRYMTEGLAGLEDRPKKGREPEIDQIEVINATLQPPPERLGVTHWSSRILGRQLGISNVTVAKIWKRWGIKPWRQETFKFSTDPELEAKIRDVVGLYLDPPEKAVVLSIDEKSQIQALDRTAPILPMRPDLPGRWTHDYLRHGTTTLFAALEIATGRVTQTCLPRHRSDEFLRFLKQVARTYPRVPLHLVVDNYAAHKHPRVKAWLAQNPRITMHFTPTSGSSSSARSPDSSTTGTPTANRSPGPRPPTRSSRTPSEVKKPNSRDTRRSAFPGTSDMAAGPSLSSRRPARMSHRRSR